MTTLPSKSWKAYSEVVKKLGEQRSDATQADLAFLGEIGFVDFTQGTFIGDTVASLSEAGLEYFNLHFIQGDDVLANKVLRRGLLTYKPVAALCQMLEGVKLARKATAESILRSQGFGHNLTERNLGTLLTIMDVAGIIGYTKSEINLYEHTASKQEIPQSVFISPDTPYANRTWLRRILSECEGYIYWLDKHFLATGLEPLWEAVDGNRVREVRILSLKLENNSGRTPLRAYRDLRKELAKKDVHLEWRFIDSSKVKKTHDRWIIGKDYVRNVPDVGTILSGKHSEMNLGSDPKTIKAVFELYWSDAVEVAPVVNESSE